MSDIFQEVDEDVRRDKALEFWTEHQNKILAVFALIILAVAGFRFYQYEREQTAEAAGAAYENAMALDAAGKPADAAAAFAALASDAPAGYATLARFAKAASLTASDPKAALTAYDALGNDSSITPLMQQAAKLRAALLRLDNGEADQGAKDLEPLAAAGSPYRSTARVTLAALALQRGDYAGAGKWLDQVVSDVEAPETVKQNAETLLGLVASNSPTK